MTKIIQGWYFTAENTPANHNPRKPDPQTIARHKIVNPKVILNIGGLKHEVLEIYYDLAVENTSRNKSAFKVMWKHLEKRPLTRLGKMMAMIVIVVMMMMVRMVRVKMIMTISDLPLY